MAGNGPPPKENRRRRNADTYAADPKILRDDDEVRGPALVGDFSPAVRSWYDNWRRSPQAAAFLMTDWMRLRMLVPLVDDYLKKPTAMKMAEIRQSESLLGATYVDRLKGRMKVEKDPEPQEIPAGVAALDDYRRDLAS
jgi:hypothetical protein